MADNSTPSAVTRTDLVAAENRLHTALNSLAVATAHIEQSLDQFEDRLSAHICRLDAELAIANQRLDGLAARMNAMEQRIVEAIEGRQS